jgi:NAD(P)-dependent dehydrogenase (short-subunit alcohol dehydrogenase family)
VTEVLRAGVLDGVRLCVVGAGPLGEAVRARAEALGATVLPAAPLPAAEPGAAPDALVVDAAAMFAAATGVDAVRAALDGAWAAIQPQATGAKLILLLAPPPGDAHAEAARAGLENLARTLSIEWARLGIRPVAIHPGSETPAGEVAELAAFLASPAGAYYSGCRFDLR